MRDTQSALKWIVNLLEKHQIPFRVSGGFAARQYGCSRELADIDVELSESYFAQLIPEVKDYVISGLEFYEDENWKLNIITLNYKGQEIDLAGIDEAQIYNQLSEKWEKLPVDFSTNVELRINGLSVPLIPKEELVAYKKKLRREVDLEDIRQLSN
jgi:hypothetical protein